MNSFEPIPGERISSVVNRAIEHYKVIGDFQFEINGRVLRVFQESTAEGLLKQLGTNSESFEPPHETPDVESALSKMNTLNFQDIHAVYNWFQSIGELLKIGAILPQTTQVSLARKIRTKPG